MMIDKYISVKAVLEQVYRDTGYQEEISHEDLIQWVIEGMDLLGYPLTYVPKIIGYKQDEAYDFTSYRVPVPCDFHKLNAIAVNGFPAYPATNQFHEMLDGACCGFNNMTSSQEDIFYADYSGDYIEVGNFSPQAAPLANPTTFDTMVTFTMNDSWITFNVEEGKACLAYWAFPLDSEGFPLVPDDTKYKIAIANYLIFKIDYRLWRGGYITDKVYQQSSDNWLWASGSASNHLKMPNVQQMETLKRSLIQLIPRFHEYQNFFRTLSSQRNRL